MKNRKFIKFFILFSLSFFLILTFSDYISVQILKSNSKEIFTLSEYPIMQIEFFGKSEDAGLKTLSAKISILDLQGSEIAVVERSWKNDGIEILFKKVKFDDKVFYFPQKVYGKNYDGSKNLWNIETSGTNFIPYYLENKKSLIYNSSNEESKKIYKIADFAFYKFSFFKNKYCSDKIIDLTHLKSGSVYTILIDSSGELKVVD